MEPRTALALAQVLALYGLWKLNRPTPPARNLSPPPEKKIRDDSPETRTATEAARSKRTAGIEAMERNRAICRWLSRVEKEQRMQGKPPTKRRVIVESDESDTAEEEERERYEVAGLLDEEVRDGKRFLLVSWVGFALPTWEPVENVDKCDLMLREFNEDVDPGFEEDF